ncbi:MAG: acrylyl-CoA reductase (NADPH) [Rhodothermales bacterium]|jgi:acrylyl-CoA reductase (NADPH)
MINALLVLEKGKNPQVELREIEPGILPEGDLDVEVLWSSLNYKDALAITGGSPIIRAPFPFVPGIDLAGRVLASRSPLFKSGDMVLQTGWGLGETRFGGFATRARLKAAHVVRIPDGLSPRSAMVAGTAGFTAMLACMALEHHGAAEGPIAVTGASGGVGSLAIAFLHRLGFQVCASSGSADPSYLKALGADEIIGREVLGAGASRPLDSARWGGAVDSVGGATLEALISQTGTRGAVAACGLAGGTEVNTTVFPFILRGVGLLGIDSNTCPQDLRLRAWDRISELLDAALVEMVSSEVELSDLPEQSRQLFAGRIQGRTVVRCAPD